MTQLQQRRQLVDGRIGGDGMKGQEIFDRRRGRPLDRERHADVKGLMDLIGMARRRAGDPDRTPLKPRLMALLAGNLTVDANLAGLETGSGTGERAERMQPHTVGAEIESPGAAGSQRACLVSFP